MVARVYRCQANGHFGAVFQYCYTLDEVPGLILVRKLRRDYCYAVRILTVRYGGAAVGVQMSEHRTCALVVREQL